MWKSTPCAAMKSGKRFHLAYDGYSRVVEIHAVGTTKDGNDIMRVWQVRGGSNSGEPQGWKLLHLDEARGGDLVDEASDAPRLGYKRNDSAMTTISCQL